MTPDTLIKVAYNFQQYYVDFKVRDNKLMEQFQEVSSLIKSAKSKQKDHHRQWQHLLSIQISPPIHQADVILWKTITSMGSPAGFLTTFPWFGHRAHIQTAITQNH